MRDMLSFSCKHTQNVCESQALIRINAAPNKIKGRLTLFLSSIIIFLEEKGDKAIVKIFKTILIGTDIAPCTGDSAHSNNFNSLS